MKVFKTEGDKLNVKKHIKKTTLIQVVLRLLLKFFYTCIKEQVDATLNC